MSLQLLCSGYLIRSPLGGLTWHHLQYLIGLERLGHNVTFCEDFGWHRSCFDPSVGQNTSDPRRGIEHFKALLDRYGVSAKWCYLAEDGTAYGMSRQQLKSICRTCDLHINLSNINWIPEFEECPRRVLVDTDPVFTQLGVQGVDGHFDRYDRCFTFGENVGRADCTMPTAGREWLPTRQPVVLDLWDTTEHAGHSRPFTTVASWRPINHTGDQMPQYGQKDRQFAPYFALPVETGHRLEVAMNPPPPVRRQLVTGGWNVVDPLEIADTPEAYQQYLRASRGEFSVAKHGYVVTHCGWFSERSACYLASGRPVVVEETGFSKWMDTGLGIVAFRSKDEAVAGLESVVRDYDTHCRAAKVIAAEYFDFAKVLPALLETAMDRRSPQNEGQGVLPVVPQAAHS